jgi:lysyl-tRNA synthetase class 2
MLEFYQAYSNYHDLMKLSEELIIFIAKRVNGTCITHFNGNEIDLGKWTKLSMREAIIKFWPPEYGTVPELAVFESGAALQAFLRERVNEIYPEAEENVSPEMNDLLLQNSPFKILGEMQAYLTSLPADEQLRCKLALSLDELRDKLASAVPLGKIIAELFELVAEPHLIQPTIIYDFPLAVSPLSKKKPDEPDWVERFEFYIGGFEVGNAFSELNDPVDQLARFEQQMTEKERGDHEAHQMDEDYVRALGYGLPPTAGEGIGIDRLTMLLTNSKSIRDVILFPLLRPQTKQAEAGEGKHGESAE